MDYRPIIFPECSLSELSHTWSVFSTLSSSFTFYISRNKWATLLYSPQRRLYYTAATFCLLFLSLWVCYSGVWDLFGVQHQILLLGCYSGRWAGCARACVWMHGQMDRWKDGVSVCVWEGGRGWPFDPLQQKKQRCSLQMSAVFRAQMEKKCLEASAAARAAHFAGFWSAHPAGFIPSLCGGGPWVFFSLPPPPALLRWPRNVLCVRLAVCQSTCVLRWRKAMRDDDTVLCHPLKLLSIPAVVVCETGPCRWITEQRCTSDKLQLVVMMLTHLSGSEAGEKTALNELYCFQ